MNKKNNHWAKWAFGIFAGLLVIINAGLTFQFGFTYLGRSFGSGLMSDYAGALYALLIFDCAYLAWFYTYLRTAESTGQRSLAIGLSGFSLFGSLSATLQQLATNATELVDLSAYNQTVGLIALGIMLLMTAAHVIACATYLLLDPRERVRQAMAEARGDALNDSLETAVRMIDNDYDSIVQIMAQKTRSDVLGTLGFTSDVKMITAPQSSDNLAQQAFAKVADADLVLLQESAPDAEPIVMPSKEAESKDENF